MSLSLNKLTSKVATDPEIFLKTRGIFGRFSLNFFQLIYRFPLIFSNCFRDPQKPPGSIPVNSHLPKHYFIDQ
ncbi:hypothetical protein HanRHA438_Chr04g0154821 [Helianthus annuus]|nr:hypothetical protein HanIR_Chr04g0155201 [Helianthus annuus]KAJ0925012.1 hypothetical protein HanRHA438_Chr04g0154821 [Helianthus annuus]